MPRIALLIEYDGTDYAGWQYQANGISVEQRIEEALGTCYGCDVDVVGSGRTDAGVHARGQVAHYDVPEGAPSIPSDKLPVAINTRLPRDIRIRAASQADDTFHARFDAIEREYVYRISTEGSVFERTTVWHPHLPFDPQTFVNACSQVSLLGQHDFTTFSKLNPSTESYICDLRELSAHYVAPYLTIRIRADRFVYGMCRLLVGGLWSVARGKTDVEDLSRRLAQQDRQFQLGSAPAHGLYLNRVRYMNGLFDDDGYL